MLAKQDSRPFEIEHIECEQGSDEWFKARLGIPTASRFDRCLAGGQGKVRWEYMRKLAGERVTGIPAEEYRNSQMDRGNAMESPLRDIWAMLADTDPVPCGFFKCNTPMGWIGASPDALIGDDGILEIKSAAPHVLIEILKSDNVPSEHAWQIQGELLVTDRAWCEVAIGYERMPMFRRRVKRDSTKIKQLEIGLEQFNSELNELERWVQRYGERIR